MQEFTTAVAVLEYAIAAEMEAHAFYLDLAERAAVPGMAPVFREFAGEELGHRRKLEEIKRNKCFVAAGPPVADLRLSDFAEAAADGEPLDYQAALILAMKKEKQAFRLYTRLADLVGDPALRQLFLAMAQEEARHKLRFEVEYDEFVLREN